MGPGREDPADGVLMTVYQSHEVVQGRADVDSAQSGTGHRDQRAQEAILAEQEGRRAK
jgi:hypothetical protein